MGCGGSVVDRKKNKKKNLNPQTKATCLVFGMPDRGQQAFADLMNKTFMTTAYSQITYSFVVVDSSRNSRKGWPKQYTQNDNVFISFFFPDFSSPGASLLSLKSLNWLNSQLKDQPKPIVIGKAKNAKEKPNLKTFQDQLSKDVTVYIPIDNGVEDTKNYYEYVKNASENIKIPEAK